MLTTASTAWSLPPDKKRWRADAARGDWISEGQLLKIELQRRER